MSLWVEAGQYEAAEILRAAAADSLSRGAAMSHAWLLTGPAGSGRSTLAYAFAAALVSGQLEPDADTLAQIEARTHPDLHVLTTEGVIIKIDDVRSIVKRSHFAPSVGRFRVIVVEDADRMTDHTSNVLLKELEEPLETTVWVLCAPSEADLLPTIRSRVRSVRLRLPDVDTVVELLHQRHGVDTERAEKAARFAQSHVGMASRLAQSDESMTRRDETIRVVLDVHSTHDAVMVAARLLEIASADSAAVVEERNAQERDRAFRSLGLEPGQAIPAALRSQIKALEDDQKRRSTRGLRDGLDRVLTDVGSLFRDILLIQLGSPLDLVNREYLAEMTRAARAGSPQETLRTLDALAEARVRIESNVQPLLALEAFLISARRAGVL